VQNHSLSSGSLGNEACGATPFTNCSTGTEPLIGRDEFWRLFRRAEEQADASPLSRLAKAVTAERKFFETNTFDIEVEVEKVQG